MRRQLVNGNMSVRFDREIFNSALRHAGHLQHRRTAIRLVRSAVEHFLSATGIHSLLDRRHRGNEPRAFRFAGSGNRTGGRISHRIQLDQVPALLQRRIHQHDHCFDAGHYVISRRLERPGRQRSFPCSACSTFFARFCSFCFCTSGCAERCRAFVLIS